MKIQSMLKYQVQYKFKNEVKGKKILKKGIINILF